MTACLESAEPNSFIAVISGAPHLNCFVGLKIMVRAPVSAYIGHLDYFTKSKKSLYPFVWTWRPCMLKDIQKHEPNHVNYTSQSLRLCRAKNSPLYLAMYMIRDHLWCLVILNIFICKLFIYWCFLRQPLGNICHCSAKFHE